jgi:hypothetical protein
MPFGTSSLANNPLPLPLASLTSKSVASICYYCICGIRLANLIFAYYYYYLTVTDFAKLRG